MMSGQQVWAVPSGGAWKLSSTKPDAPDARQIGSGEIFTLTGTDCVTYGSLARSPTRANRRFRTRLGDLKLPAIGARS